MENPKIDFEFGWWISMTPAFLAAVYFVYRWAHNQSEVASLGIAAGCISLGLLISSLICHPGFNSRGDVAQESDSGKPEEIAKSPSLEAASTLSAAERSRSAGEAQQPANDTNVGYEQLRSSSLTPAQCEGTTVNIDDEFHPRQLSPDEVDATISAIHAACCAEELSRVSDDGSGEMVAVFDLFSKIKTDGSTTSSPTGTVSDTTPDVQKEADTDESLQAELRSIQAKFDAAAAQGIWTEPPKNANNVDKAEMDSWFTKGMALIQSGNFRDALYCFQFVIQKDPRHLPSLTTKAICLFQMRRYGEALKAFEQVQAIDSTDVRAKEGIAATMKRLHAAANG
jgi:tetratricopeptide (TPR) repeat protein